jgi:hypothetical protein
MNVHNRLLIALLFGLLFSLCRGGQIATTAHGIKMIVDYGYIGSPLSKEGSFLDANVYLKNDSTESLNIAVGPILGPNYATGWVNYLMVLDTDADGTMIKPSPSSLDIVELKPGDIPN